MAAAAGVTGEQTQATLRFALSLILGGVLSFFIRGLYKRFGTTLTHREDFANLFPLFTLTTIVVIFVVRSSLALSLGVIGALSIVRFRSAIKSPEELVYLLFCVAVGVSLGAYQIELAFVTVAVITLFVVTRSITARSFLEKKLLLTVSGPDNVFVGQDGVSVLDRARDIAGGMVIQRLDRDDEQFQFRGILTLESSHDTEGLVTRLRETLPMCDLSCVDADDLF
jgi:hypothetical protein